ncbi:hybrid sensor histidine kinase/response regulator [Oscillatoria salina]|uniref:hybrid sensor histidine kinase/response regulator n=1 Tax=Oscillatoria salina TaxID=331517 RepID=UPI0013B73CF4|nr:response regulator [Oscillatoria salina]MBZ8179219.1 hybrid sensor histidine kinase/response regulator [Oscillatoria salina IIICB1]NET89663.1 hybrid sensor histidine kinase/response regulator [Kamptonema sp. SIO1D9]
MNLDQQTTLLIVDDNPTNIKVLFNFLKNAGFRVLVAKDGKDALKKVEVAIPDLILLDVMMPGIDGFETCRFLKENPQYHDLPIIFMTALADTKNKVKGLSLGAVDYITKPFQQEEVLARINLHLQLCFLRKELAEKNERLSELNTQLEQKVLDRTSQLAKLQSQLILNEKMSSLGQLVAGIAHEINNPISFIVGNLTHAEEYAQDLINLIQLYQKYYPEPATEIAEKMAAIELDYLTKDFCQLITSMQSGTKRILQISHSMRTFSRADLNKKVKFNLHEGLDSTLLILKHRLKANRNRPAIEVKKKYGNLPEIDCYPGQLNQVFMNLLSNGIDAVEAANCGVSFAEIQANPNCLIIETKLLPTEPEIMIIIRDNGIGIEPEVQAKIFDYLFTTKEVGKGTGLGLAIAREIVEDKHGGTIACSSKKGEGTEFRVILPIQSS